MMEKRFFREYSNPQEDFKRLAKLRLAGAHTVPSFRLAATKNKEGKLEKSLVMTDLTKRGRYDVYSSNQFFNNKKVYDQIRGLKNYDELIQRMTEDQIIALSLGYALWGDTWLFAVDKKKNVGQVYLTDVDNFYPYYDYVTTCSARDIEKIGLNPGDLRMVLNTVQAIKRKSKRPHDAAVGAITKEIGNFEYAVKTAVRKAIATHANEFRSITKIYGGVIGLATGSQIGGAFYKKDSSGLTKEQRRALYERMKEKSSVVEDNYRDKYGDKKARRYLARSLFPDVKEVPIKTIRTKSRQEQWDMTMIGKHAAQIIARERRAHGKPLFAYEPEKILRFEKLKADLAAAKTPEEARELLEGQEEVLAHKMKQIIYQGLQHDLGTIARFRVRKDLLPYAIPEWKLERRQKFFKS